MCAFVFGAFVVVVFVFALFVVVVVVVFVDVWLCLLFMYAVCTFSDGIGVFRLFSFSATFSVCSMAAFLFFQVLGHFSSINTHTHTHTTYLEIDADCRDEVGAELVGSVSEYKRAFPDPCLQMSCGSENEAVMMTHK